MCRNLAFNMYLNCYKYGYESWAVMVHPFISVLRRQRQVDLCEYKASLVYRVSFRTARAIIERNTILK